MVKKTILYLQIWNAIIPASEYNNKIFIVDPGRNRGIGRSYPIVGLL